MAGGSGIDFLYAIDGLVDELCTDSDDNVLKDRIDLLVC
jgi:hypothetical protein